MCQKGIQRRFIQVFGCLVGFSNTPCARHLCIDPAGQISRLWEFKKQSQGQIVTVASMSGVSPQPGMGAYSVSKAGLIMLTRLMAQEWAADGIRANCVAPGPVRTKLAMAVHTQEIIDAYHDAIPLNRYGSEDEIANVICFLCSDKASYVTGQTIAVDGGFESTGVGLPALRK